MEIINEILKLASTHSWRARIVNYRAKVLHEIGADVNNVSLEELIDKDKYLNKKYLALEKQGAIHRYNRIMTDRDRNIPTME